MLHFQLIARAYVNRKIPYAGFHKEFMFVWGQQDLSDEQP